MITVLFIDLLVYLCVRCRYNIMDKTIRLPYLLWFDLKFKYIVICLYNNK